MQRWRMRRCGPSVISGRETVPKDNALGTEVPARRLAQIPQITECHRVTGDPCVIMQAAVGSMGELEDLINRVAQFGLSKTSVVLSSAIEPRVPLGHLDMNGKAKG